MLTRPTPSGIGSLIIRFDGREIVARSGDSIAIALLAAGITTTRTTALSGTPRGPFCLMGACFECLAVVDGQANVQTCMTPARSGMQVETQTQVRAIGQGKPP